MRQYILTFCAAIFGAIFGYVGAIRVDRVHAAASAEKTEVRELVLLNEKGETTARLYSLEGRTVLRISSATGSPALELGVDNKRSTAFLRYFGLDGRVIAALNSSPPNGETTLYLGDNRWESRMIVGALRADTQPRNTGIEEWGMQIRSPGSRIPAFSAVSREAQPDSPWGAGLRLTLANGKEWEAH
jgi:hypothetical protein